MPNSLDFGEPVVTHLLLTLNGWSYSVSLSLSTTTSRSSASSAASPQDSLLSPARLDGARDRLARARLLPVMLPPPGASRPAKPASTAPLWRSS
jgi:hypothetical protein